MAKSNLGMPDNLALMLAQADKQRGFPTGTMASVMQQESGGTDKFLNDPAAYHYGLNAAGKRVAPQSNKVSTAFGPFGILESTAKDPGYGVKPLQNKSLEEQVRFSSEYLAARSKSAGGLEKGLAGYGEGSKYGQQVMGRIGNAPAPVVASATTPVVQQPVMQGGGSAAPVAFVPPEEPAPMQVANTPSPVDAWAEFLKTNQRDTQPADLAYGPQEVVIPQRTWDSPTPAVVNTPIDFSAFMPMQRKRA